MGQCCGTAGSEEPTEVVPSLPTVNYNGKYSTAVRLRLVLRFDVRSELGLEVSVKIGHFLDFDMTRIIHSYIGWVDYGDHQFSEGHSSTVLVVSSDDTFYTGSQNGEIFRWDLHSRMMIGEWTINKYSRIKYLDVHFTHIIANGTKGPVMYDCNSDELIWKIKDDNDTNRINDAKFNQNGTKIVACTMDGSVLVWDANNGDQLRNFHRPIDGAVFYSLFTGINRIVSLHENDHLLVLWDDDNGVAIDEVRSDMMIAKGTLKDEEKAVSLSAEVVGSLASVSDYNEENDDERRERKMEQLLHDFDMIPSSLSSFSTMMICVNCDYTSMLVLIENNNNNDNNEEGPIPYDCCNKLFDLKAESIDERKTMLKCKYSNASFHPRNPHLFVAFEHNDHNVDIFDLCRNQCVMRKHIDLIHKVMAIKFTLDGMRIVISGVVGSSDESGCLFILDVNSFAPVIY